VPGATQIVEPAVAFITAAARLASGMASLPGFESAPLGEM
jgi:hypothetical protein